MVLLLTLDRYSDSKILLYYAMREVAAQSPISNSESNVIINVNTPGLCHSELGRDMPRRSFLSSCDNLPWEHFKSNEMKS